MIMKFTTYFSNKEPVFTIQTMCFLALLVPSMTIAQTNDMAYLLAPDNLSNVTITNQDSSNTVDIPVIKHQARQAIVKGVVVFIADIQAQGYTDQNLILLSQRLPDFGWNTLLVTPKAEYFVVEQNLAQESSIEEPSDQETNEEVASETEATETVDESSATPNDQQIELRPTELQSPELPYTAQQYEQFTATLLNALQQKFMQSPGYQVIYVQGKSASSLLSILSEDADLGLSALIINNPYWPEVTQNKAIAKDLAKTTIPVLDLLNQSDNTWSKQSAKNRLIETRIALKPLYRQRQVIGIDLSAGQSDYIAKEMVGFLHYLGW
jgi:hypothetical protein